MLPVEAGALVVGRIRGQVHVGDTEQDDGRRRDDDRNGTVSTSGRVAVRVAG